MKHLIVFLLLVLFTNGDTTCTTCSHLIQLLEEVVPLNKSLSKEIIVETCHLLPLALEKSCDLIGERLVVDYLPVAVAFLEKRRYDGFNICCFIGLCTSSCCAKAEVPEQVHVSLTGYKGEMAVVWLSTVEGEPVGFFGKEEGVLGAKVKGETRTFSQGGFKGFIHQVVVKNLEPGSLYYYKVGDEEYGFSEVFSFRTYPEKPKVTKILQVGDLGSEPVSFNTHNRIKARALSGEYDFVMHVGDLAYADGIQSIFDYYFRRIEPWAARVPYMTSPGNHEIVFNFTSYNNRVYMPYKYSDAVDNTYYSFDQGYAHYVALNSDRGILEDFNFAGITKQQVDWLANDLKKAAANREKYPWIIVYVHRPLYCSQDDFGEVFDNCGDEAQYIRENFEDLFYKYKVDLVISGHKHSYERLYPVYRGNVLQQSYDKPSYPVYVVNGAAGNREMHSTGFFPNPPIWSAFRDGTNFGYGIITIFNETGLKYEFYESEKDTLVDDFYISK